MAYLEEGRRATRLRHALNVAINQCLKVPSYNRVARALDVVHKKHSSRLRSIHAKLIKQLAVHVGEELDQMFEEENIVQLCNGLDDIVQRAETVSEGENALDPSAAAAVPTPSSMPAWRPSGDAADDLRDHVAESKEQLRSRLQQMLSVVLEENHQLEQELADVHRQLSATRDVATSVARDLCQVADEVESEMNAAVDEIRLL